jgi:hypothetical protein
VSRMDRLTRRRAISRRLCPAGENQGRSFDSASGGRLT